MTDTEQPAKGQQEATESRTAKKDFVICHNAYFREIREGDDLSDLPPMFLENMKTENVL